MNSDAQFWITTMVATYAAIVATLSFFASLWLGILEINRLKPKVRVRPRQGFLYSNGKVSESFVSVEAVNTGSGSVVITGVGWLLSNHKKATYINPYNLTLPYKLDEHRACTFYLPARWYREFRDRDKIVCAFFQDEAGHMWQGKVTRKMRRLWETMDNDGWKIAWNDDLKTWYTID